jgi:hypothetical protein
MNDGDMANPRPLYGACVRTAEVICTTRTSFGQKRYHVRRPTYTSHSVLVRSQLRQAEYLNAFRAVRSDADGLGQVAPRVYCLLSAAPLFDALFATLHAVLRLERREHTKMIEVRSHGLLLLLSNRLRCIVDWWIDWLDPGCSATTARQEFDVSNWHRGVNSDSMACRN